MIIRGERSQSDVSHHGVSKGPRTSTQQMIHQVRAEVWGRGFGIESFSGFASHLTAAEMFLSSRFRSMLRQWIRF
jgi:hypothetical protein